MLQLSPCHVLINLLISHIKVVPSRNIKSFMERRRRTSSDKSSPDSNGSRHYGDNQSDRGSTGRSNYTKSTSRSGYSDKRDRERDDEHRTSRNDFRRDDNRRDYRPDSAGSRRNYSRRDDSNYGDHRRSYRNDDSSRQRSDGKDGRYEGGRSYGNSRYSDDRAQERGGYRRSNEGHNAPQREYRKSYNDEERAPRGSYKRSYNSEDNEKRPYDRGSRGSSYGSSDSGSRIRSSKRDYSQGGDNKRPSYSRNKKSEDTKFVDKSRNREDIRLNRYISNSGICSRREADELIVKGLIAVNGKIITELGTRISINDVVQYNGKKLIPEHKVYILMNKPKGYVTTLEDPHADHTVMELLGDHVEERVYPIGRLDKDTTGVLLLTNDGDLTKKLTHPKFERRKIYHAFLDKSVTKDDLFKLTEGIEIEEGVVVAADAASIPDADDKTQIGLEIHSGQNRVVRRMFEALGYRVKKLDRVYFAGLTKKNVQRGKWRYLSDKEVIMLKRGTF